MSKDLEKFLRGVVWAGVFAILLAPLVYVKTFFFPFIAPRAFWLLGFIEITFAAWLVLAIHNPQYRPKRNLLNMTVVAFVAIVFVTSLFGVDFGRSFWGAHERMTSILLLLHTTALFFVVSNFFRKRADWEKIFLFIMGIANIVALIDLGAKAGLWEHLSPDKGSTFGNTSFFGTYLMLAGLLGLWLTLITAERKKQIFTGVLLVPIVYALAISTAFAAWFSFLGAVVLIGLFWLAFRPKNIALQWIGKGGIAASVVGVMASAYLLFQEGSIVNRAFTGLATKSRLIVWDMAWKGFLDKPIFGWGYGGFEFATTKYFNPCLDLPVCGGEPWFDRAHNVIMETLVTGGVAGIMALIVFSVVPVFVLWRAYLRDGLQREHKTSNKPHAIGDKHFIFWTASVFTAFFGAYFMQNLTVFDTPNTYVMVFLVLGAVAAFLYGEHSAREAKNKKERWKPKPAISVSVVSVFLIVALNAFVFTPAQANRSLVRAVAMPSNAAQRLSELKRGIEGSLIHPGQALLHTTDSVVGTVPNSREEFIEQNADAELGFLWVFLKKEIEENPLDYRARYALTKVLNALGKFSSGALERAEIESEEAIKISPNNPRGYWELAKAQVQAGELEEASRTIERAIEVQPDIFFSYALAISIAQEMGDEELLERYIKMTEEVNSEWGKAAREHVENNK